MVILFLYIRKRTSCFWFTSAVKNPTFFLWETVVTQGNHLCWKPLSFVYHTFCKTLVLLNGVRIDLRGFVKNCSEVRRWASLLSYLASNMAIVKLEVLNFLRNEEIYLQLSQRSWIDIYKQMFLKNVLFSAFLLGNIMAWLQKKDGFTSGHFSERASPLPWEINEGSQISNNLHVVLYRIFMIHVHFSFSFSNDIW